VLPRNLRPIRLSRRSEPFDSADFIYELKIDGFRALAYIVAGQGELISRNGYVFRGFAELLKTFEARPQMPKNKVTVAPVGRSLQKWCHCRAPMRHRKFRLP